jgi:N-acetylglucosamine kinase-like BadF-type ATPase
VVIAGTGSVVVGKTPRGEIIQTGGWGRVIGDEGSGYYLGREALLAVALQYDRRGDATKLREAFAKEFEWETREQVVDSVYKDKFDIASLAPIVFETASRNDPVSQRILQKGATHLAEQVSVIVLQMGILRKVGLVMCGASSTMKRCMRISFI